MIEWALGAAIPVVFLIGLGWKFGNSVEIAAKEMAKTLSHKEYAKTIERYGQELSVAKAEAEHWHSCLSHRFADGKDKEIRELEARVQTLKDVIHTQAISRGDKK